MNYCLKKQILLYYNIHNPPTHLPTFIPTAGALISAANKFNIRDVVRKFDFRLNIMLLLLLLSLLCSLILFILLLLQVNDEEEEEVVVVVLLLLF